MSEPLVTIVVSACRRVEYLPQALASALAQTFTDFEIIVSDDGSGVEIANLVAGFRDPRIRYRQNATNLGIAMNHHVAFLEAKGRYIANLDDDDIWEPEFLAKLVPPLETDPGISVAFCDHHLIDSEGRFLTSLADQNSRTYRRATLAPGRHQPFLEMAVVHQAIPMAMGAVFRKSILDGADYPARIGGCYDHWLAYLATKDGAAIFYSPERLTRYRVHSGSGSATRGIQNLRNSVYVRSRFLKDPRLAPFRAPLRHSLGVFYGRMAVQLLPSRTRRALLIERHALSLMNRPRSILGLLKNTAVYFLRRIGKTSGRRE